MLEVCDCKNLLWKWPALEKKLNILAKTFGFLIISGGAEINSLTFD